MVGHSPLKLQGGRNNVSIHLTLSSLAFFFYPEEGGKHVPPKYRFILNAHSATPPKVAFFNINKVYLPLQL
jgi:hypothetical protein